MQIIKNIEKSTAQPYYDSLFEITSMDWRDIYFLPRKTIINTKLKLCFIPKEADP